MADCAVCPRPVPDTAVVCRDCERDLARQLHQAAELWPELETTITRQARMSDPGPRARGHAPPQPIRPGLGDPADDHQRGAPDGLPFAWRAAEVADVVRNVVTTWVRVVQEERAGVVAGPTDMPRLMRWLAGQLGWARYQRWADELWDHVDDACGLVAPAVDRPALRVRVAVGPCPELTCTGEITATVPSRLDRPALLRCGTCRPALLRCGTCGGEWGTHQWARVGRRIMTRMEMMGA